MKTELLIDGDLYAFSTAIALEEDNPFVEGEKQFDEELGKKVLTKRLKEIEKRFKPDSITVCLSCPREENYRLTMVSDTYKQHRAKKAGPIGLRAMKDFIVNNYDVVTEPFLEADDLLGMMATDPNRSGRKIVVSWDKDVTAIEGESFNPQKDSFKKVSKVVSLKFFLYQALIGDSADGYKGLNKIGPKRAKAFLNSIKPLSMAWEKMVELALKQGHDEEYMLQQCRLAWIMRHGDYDWKTKEIKLWTPERIMDYL